MTLPLIANALVFSFILCCLVSAGLQFIAWWKHAHEGAPVGLRALWRPEGHFDEVGVRQMRLARRLLAVGGTAYLLYGALLFGSSLAQRGGT